MNTLLEQLEISQLSEFFSIAKDAGQEIELFVSGDPQISYFRIDSMGEAKRILSRATVEQRVKRGRTFLDGLEYRKRIAQGMHDRGEAFVYANLSPEDLIGDKRGHSNHFPIHVRTMSVPQKIVPAGEVWDITLSPSEWNENERVEMYNLVNVGRLILEPNASVVVHGNALTFTCAELVKMGSSSNEYDIGILSTHHGFGYRTGAFDGHIGQSGRPGSRGSDGVQPVLKAHVFGPLRDVAFDRDSLNGGPGGAGEPGAPAQDGLNGGACRIAEINIRSVVTSAPLVIGVISGDGGNGGRGGDGGNGGDGGDGIGMVNTGQSPGIGGAGGAAGPGGNGGKAGHSGISSNVFINVPESDRHRIRTLSRSGNPGNPGSGGLPGKPGSGGRHGGYNHPSTSYGGGTGPGGCSGVPGRDGRAGRKMPPAKVYINDELLDQ